MGGDGDGVGWTRSDTERSVYALRDASADETNIDGVRAGGTCVCLQCPDCSDKWDGFVEQL